MSNRTNLYSQKNLVIGLSVIEDAAAPVNGAHDSGHDPRETSDSTAHQDSNASR